jgi:transposase
MARSKEGVHESLAQIRQLVRDYSGTRMEKRVAMLKMLKEQPKRTFQDVAERLESSERNIQRWWELYRKEGTQGLLKQRQAGGQRPRRLDDRALAALQQKVETDGIKGLSEVQEWLQEEFGVRYSRSGVWYLMRKTVGAMPRGWVAFHDDDFGNPVKHSTQQYATSGVPPHIVRFLNAMPDTGNRVEWIDTFREAIRGLLGDVDRVSIAADFTCDLVSPETHRPSNYIQQHPQTAHIQIDDAQKSPVERLLDGFRHGGVPFHLYHSPHAYEYYFREQAYVGAIFLWREKEKSPISEKTLKVMEELRPFLTFAISDLVARYQIQKPVGRIFINAVAEMKEEAKLSPQEERVVTLQLIGHSYKDIADKLFVTVDTVKKHFKQVYKKTRTKGQSELFAKYFTSRISFDDTSEEEEDI